MIEGQSVDVICKAEDLIKKFGKNSFDVVISTEALEHARDWKKFISNIKNICKPKGIILVTTRSRGFGYHGYPYDFWRYELDDMRHIFSDFEILSLEKDIIGPGVLIKVRKPNKFTENDLSDYKLYSIISNKKKTEITDSDLKSFRFKRITIIEKIKNFSKSTYHKAISGLYNPERITK
jgi:SAM-dependent methyltransferase